MSSKIWFLTLFKAAENEFRQGITKNQFYKILQLYKFPQKAFRFAIDADNEA